MKTATFVKRLGDFTGHAELFRLSEPLGCEWDEDCESHSLVIVSATVVPYSGPETYIFGANEDGTVAAWVQLDGSYRGGLSIDDALTGAGYEIERGV